MKLGCFEVSVALSLEVVMYPFEARGWGRQKLKSPAPLYSFTALEMSHFCPAVVMES